MGKLLGESMVAQGASVALLDIDEVGVNKSMETWRGHGL